MRERGGGGGWEEGEGESERRGGGLTKIDGAGAGHTT
jgi:hypothetical protein